MVLPVFRLPKTTLEQSDLPEFKLLAGEGATVREELGKLHEIYQEAESAALDKLAEGGNWQRGQFVGTDYIIPALTAILIGLPILLLLFAYFSYGKMWGVIPMYYT